MAEPQIVWFRQDLRTADQAALAHAASLGPVLPVYVLDDETPGEWRIGGAQRWWLHHSLASLGADLAKLGAPLHLARGRAGPVLAELSRALGGAPVHALRHYEPWAKVQQDEVAQATAVHLHDGNYLLPPGTLATGSGGHYRIFSPYWTALQKALPPAKPKPAPRRLDAADHPAGDALTDWQLLPTRPNWATGFDVWTPGEAGAAERLAAFTGRIAAYKEARNLPGQEGSSSLSPYLHWGEISPAAVWHAVGDTAVSEPYRRELGWRDFATGLIHAFPDSPSEHGRAEFARFAYRDAPDDLEAWRRGRTGYPIVDAGLRQLWAIGWMHNRVRMIAASFLVKHLLVDWREGARWFWDTLVDANLGNNTLGWQWIMGSGVDSQPFNRVFAPVTQSRKFDAAGYIRRWVPELAHLDDEAIHAPWEHGGVKNYPPPLIDHAVARARALATYAAARA